MKTMTFVKTVVLSALALVMTGCLTAPTSLVKVNQATSGATVAPAADEQPQMLKAVKCDTPALAISIAPLQCKAASCQEQEKGTGNMAALIALAKEQEGIPDLSGFGYGMTDMLTTSLASTGCFDVLDRELMAELAQEQRLAGKDVTLASADALTTGAITSLTYDKAKSSFGGGFIPVIGGVTSSKVTAKIGMDVKVVDVNTGRVAYTQTYKAESGKRTFGIAGGGLIGGGIVGGAHSVKGGVEMEEAAREIIYNATIDMVEKMVAPGQYEVELVEVTPR